MAEDEDNPDDVKDQEGAPEGEEGEGAEGEGAEGGDKKKKMILMIAGGVVLLLVAAGAGLYFTGMLDSLLGKSHETPECEVDEHGEPIDCEHAEEGGEDHGSGGEDHGGGGDGHGGPSSNFLAIPTMLVNLNTEDGTPRYLRLTVQLELMKSSDYAAVEAVIPRVIDQFQTYLRELRVKDLRGSAGIYRLQMELLWRVNQAAAPVKVKDVLFQEILIQ